MQGLGGPPVPPRIRHSRRHACTQMPLRHGGSGPQGWCLLPALCAGPARARQYSSEGPSPCRSQRQPSGLRCIWRRRLHAEALPRRQPPWQRLSHASTPPRCRSATSLGSRRPERSCRSARRRRPCRPISGWICPHCSARRCCLLAVWRMRRSCRRCPARPWSPSGPCLRRAQPPSWCHRRARCRCRCCRWCAGHPDGSRRRWRGRRRRRSGSRRKVAARLAVLGAVYTPPG
mmetsp:Transcript_60079/g.168421  ORF Transcript_60079/g.168421 Transcript_60079/m.168421 type:complete len:232 (-) Transcript_60079:205-900(-)